MVPPNDEMQANQPEKHARPGNALSWPSALTGVFGRSVVRRESSPSGTLFEHSRANERESARPNRCYVPGIEGLIANLTVKCSRVLTEVRVSLDVQTEHSSNSRALAGC